MAFEIFIPLVLFFILLGLRQKKPTISVKEGEGPGGGLGSGGRGGHDRVHVTARTSPGPPSPGACSPVWTHLPDRLEDVAGRGDHE